jgi:hypothetical protein
LTETGFDFSTMYAGVATAAFAAAAVASTILVVKLGARAVKRLWSALS